MSGGYIQLAAHDGGDFKAYLALPEAPRGPVVVVLQEIFGVNRGIREVVEDFAKAGYIAIAPDLFWRQERGVELDPGKEMDRERAMALMKGFDQDLAVRDALTALAEAKLQQGANGRCAAVGYCLGGKLSYLLAARSDLRAAVSYYGVGIQGALDEARQIRGALLLHFAADDNLCPSEAQKRIADAMQPLGEKVMLRTYSGVGHAFARRGGVTFHHQMAEQADSATLSFLEAHL